MRVEFPPGHNYSSHIHLTVDGYFRFQVYKRANIHRTSGLTHHTFHGHGRTHRTSRRVRLHPCPLVVTVVINNICSKCKRACDSGCWLGGHTLEMLS